MTPRTFAKKMQAIKETYQDDKEVMHARMDGLLCQVLKDLGYKEGVEIFETTDLWCA